jgi:hypothetical protein
VLLPLAPPLPPSPLPLPRPLTRPPRRCLNRGALVLTKGYGSIAFEEGPFHVPDAGMNVVRRVVAGRCARELGRGARQRRILTSTTGERPFLGGFVGIPRYVAPRAHECRVSRSFCTFVSSHYAEIDSKEIISYLEREKRDFRVSRALPIVTSF